MRITRAHSARAAASLGICRIRIQAKCTSRTTWAPYLHDTISVFDDYHYGTQQFDHHRKQLTLSDPAARTCRRSRSQ